MKLFVTDYDGTLFTDESTLKENIKMLKKLCENNIKIVISTGRSYQSIKKEVDINNIPYDYLSCADGSIIYNKHGILAIFEMNNEIIEPFKDFYKSLNYHEIQVVYQDEYKNIYLENTPILGINICLKNENCNKEIVKSFLNIKKTYPNYNFLNYIHPKFTYLCIKPKGITKASTIQYLENKYSINHNNIYVIGDSNNDYELIKKYHGVCMENSCIDILNIAKKRYSSVKDYIKDILKEDGIY